MKAEQNAETDGEFKVLWGACDMRQVIRELRFFFAAHALAI